jgi:TonB family protein
MSKAMCGSILVVLVLSIVPFSLQAQDNDHPENGPSDNSDAIPVSISKDSLASRGFSFDDQHRPLCKVTGSEGTCRVEAFVFGEKNGDGAAYTCSKLDKSSYVGHCVDGKLDGLSLVIADGKSKQTREAFISYFDKGRIAYPALTSYLSGDTNFGVRQQHGSYGCVYFGRWDQSAERCERFTRIYGPDLFTESNAQKLRDGVFDLGHYRAKFLEFMQDKGQENQPFPKDFVTPLKLIHEVPPIYPTAARAEGVEGTVKLRVLIDKEGKVKEAEPISGPKELIPAALDAVRQWRYEPVLVYGKPSDARSEITVNFKLP